VTVSLTGARFRRFAALAAIGVLAASLTACGGDDNKSDSAGGTDSTGGGATSSGGDDYQIKLGYFPNLTHASAIVGIDQGYFDKDVAAKGGSVKYFDFNSGSDVITALQSGALDASYIGPGPSITAYATDQSIRVISGATYGGASLMVSKDIASAADLAGKTLATPGPGNTQDVALKYWLAQQGYDVDAEGKGDLTVVNLDNSDTVTQFTNGQIDGAWVPEPYASILESEGATRLVNEKTLWPGGKFVTTQLVASTKFIDEHPDLVEGLLQGQVDANDYIAQNGDAAKAEVGKYITEKTGSQIPADSLDTAWNELTFTNDPIADSLIVNMQHAVKDGFYDTVPDLDGIFDLDPLNKLLSAAGEDTVSGPSK
jgi:NitT/TauT family transport system substrate-binding protein